jgi:hypothetical protein
MKIILTLAILCLAHGCSFYEPFWDKDNTSVDVCETEDCKTIRIEGS